MLRLSQISLRLSTPAFACLLAGLMLACTGSGGSSGSGACNPAFTDAGCPDVGDSDTGDTSNNGTTDLDAGNTNNSTNNGTNNDTNNGTNNDTNNGTTGTETGTTGTTSEPDVPVGPTECETACELLDTCDFVERAGFTDVEDCISVCDREEDAFANSGALTCLDNATCDTALACVFDGDPCEGVVCADEDEICVRPSGLCATFACQEDTFEPNNQAREATPLPSEDLFITDLTTCGSDADLYTFTLPPNTDARIDVLFAHDRGDIDVEFSDAQFRSVQVRGNSQDDNEFIFIPRYVEEQTFGIRIGAYDNDAQNFYDLRLEIDPPGIMCRNNSHCPGDTLCDFDTNTCDTECTVSNDCSDGFVCNSDGTCIASLCEDDPAEPNNEEDEAFSIAEGTLDNLSLCLDDDYYEIVVADDNTDLFLGLYHSVADADIDMVLRDSANQTISRSETESDDEFIFARGLSADTYTLRVYSGDETLGAAYSLELLFNPNREICDRVECSECFTDNDCSNEEVCVEDACVPSFCTSDSFEPNDDTPATLSEGTYTGLSICTRDDNDYFNFTIDSTSDVWLFVDYEIGLGDLDITVHDSNDDLVARRETNTRDEALTLNNLAAGTYTLRVYTTTLDLNTPYNLTLAVNPSFTLCEDDNACANGEMCTEALICRGEGSCDYNAQCDGATPACDTDTNTCAACEDDALEPNDDFATAKPLSDIASRPLNTCGGDDVFSINLEGGQLTRIDVLFEHNDGNLDALLLDAQNNIVARGESPDSNEILSFQAPATGTYYILVYGYEGTYNSYGIQVRYE